MSVYKRCSRARFLDDGTPNPWFCETSPRCEHHWHYYFRMNGRRYRASTETHDKRQAENIEARERSRILDGRHGIRRQPDITFKEFATIYLRDHADLHKKSAKRDREILKTLNRFFGSAIIHEITSHRIEQFKGDRLNGTWRAFRQRRAANPVKPATVNRELDTLKSILSKAVEWKYLVDSPATGVKRFIRVQNRRTRILSADEQRRLLDACERTPKLQALLKLALITGARIGELRVLRWEDCQDGYLTFWNTKNGKVRRIPITDTIAALLASRSRILAWVFTNTKTEKPYTTIRKVFERALERAKITTGDVTVHTLRHTALSRMIEHGLDDDTVMSISGHSSTRMLQRYTHPTLERRFAALETFNMSTKCPQDSVQEKEAAEAASFARNSGGRREDRTPDLRVANAALSQLS
jgi:integrase